MKSQLTCPRRVYPGRRLPKRLVADHEAAHAIIGHRLGFAILGLTIRPRGDIQGRTFFGRHPKDPLALALMFLAGSAAEQVFHGMKRNRASIGDLNLIRAMGYRPLSISTLMLHARGVVWVSRRRIRLVAEALLEHGELDGPAFRRIAGPKGDMV